MPKRAVFNPFSRQRLAQSSGAAFEAYVQHAAMRGDVLCIQNGLRAKWSKGRLIPLRTSLLDFLLVGPTGQFAMVDAKQFRAKRFGVSRLEAHQRMLAMQLCARSATAGFIVHLTEADAVIYIDGSLLSGDARQGFGAADGILLGTLKDFSLSPVLGSRP